MLAAQFLAIAAEIVLAEREAGGRQARKRHTSGTPSGRTNELAFWYA